jgi:hypothetical protein
MASYLPVLAPDGTAADPMVPLSSTTVAAMVGFPRESRISLALMLLILDMLLPF